MKSPKRWRTAALAAVALFLALIVFITWVFSPQGEKTLWWFFPQWTESESAELRSLWLGSLEPLAPDPSNRVADSPAATALGARFFFDPGFSANGQVSCATCHQPERDFTDGLSLSQGVGLAARNAPTLIGAAYSPWYFWDGRADSLWAQATGPLESPVEHGGDRMQYAHRIFQNYRVEYEALFGPLPDLADENRFPPHAGPVETPVSRAAWESMSPDDQQAVTEVFVNFGKAVAAYQQTILPGESRFDRYVAALMAGNSLDRMRVLSPAETNGLRLFIRDGECTKCHNGPLFTNNSFHNVGTLDSTEPNRDHGRIDGAKKALASQFNCLGPYSDAQPEECVELNFIRTEGHDIYDAFKTPTLRNVTRTGPYLHDGRMATLAEVLDLYNRAPQPPFAHSELNPLGLTQGDLNDLEAFLGTLEGEIRFYRIQ